MSSILIVRLFNIIKFLKMNKTYKTLNTNSIFITLYKIITQSTFVGFFFPICSTNIDFKKFKKLFFTLKLKTLICKNNFLRKFLNSFKTPFLSLPFSFIQGKSLIVYSFSNSFLQEKKELSLFNSVNQIDKISPLVFYFSSRLFYLNDFLLFLKKNIFVDFILFLFNYTISIFKCFSLSNLKLFLFYESINKFKKSKICCPI